MRARPTERGADRKTADSRYRPLAQVTPAKTVRVEKKLILPVEKCRRVGPLFFASCLLLLCLIIVNLRCSVVFPCSFFGFSF